MQGAARLVSVRGDAEADATEAVVDVGGDAPVTGLAVVWASDSRGWDERE
jgi:hypothetical protein